MLYKLLSAKLYRPTVFLSPICVCLIAERLTSSNCKNIHTYEYIITFLYPNIPVKPPVSPVIELLNISLILAS